MEIPEAESLLHADCNEQEVICEVSRYVPRGTEPEDSPAHFIASVQIEGGGIGLTLVLQTVSDETPAPLMQSKLQLPLSQWGTLLTDGTSHLHVFFKVLTHGEVLVFGHLLLYPVFKNVCKNILHGDNLLYNTVPDFSNNLLSLSVHL